jgi:type I restriction enzyme S subunit
MSSEPGLGGAFGELDGLCKAEIWPLEVGKVRERPNRLEATYYASDGYTALEALYQSGFELTTVGKLARVLWFGPFARRYVDDPERGLPFLSSSHMMEARPRDYPLISLKHTRNLAGYQVRDGQILVSCSGTIGNVVLVTKDLDGFAVSQHAIRVIPKDPLDLGLLYCYLQSALGQFLLKRSTSGSVVTSIYEADVANLPIPKLPLELRRDLTERIRKVSALRVEANRLLDEAERMVQEQLDLPPIEDFTSTQSSSGATTFNVSAAKRVSRQIEYGQQRLDATFYDPAVAALREHLTASAAIPLSRLLTEIRNSNLRKRVYVDDPDYGVALMGGRQLTQLRPAPIAWLSRFATKGLSSERVQENWILVSCGGTVGRVSMVDRHTSGIVYTQDVMRVICNPKKTYPGFIYAFLASAYGRTQLLSASYGSVQKKLRTFHTGDILIRLPSDDGASIHQKVCEAFDARATAADFEDSAYARFADALKESKNTPVSA